MKTKTLKPAEAAGSAHDGKPELGANGKDGRKAKGKGKGKGKKGKGKDKDKKGKSKDGLKVKGDIQPSPEMRRRVERTVERTLVPPGKRIRLERDYDPDDSFGRVEKDDAAEKLEFGVDLLAQLQARLYAQKTWSVLIVLQAMDAAGKDGTIKHVMSGVNPQGCHVTSFKAPSSLELAHDYLWRSAKALPERGQIGIFNRSYYEEVLVARVHPSIIERQNLPPASRDKDIWKRRFEEINNFERYLVDNGTVILKFFLNISREEQRGRFLERIDRPEKNWKFSASDAKERGHWKDYMNAYEDVFNNTSTPWAPWYVVPANKKWYSRLVVCAAIVLKLMDLKLEFPKVTAEHRASLREAGRLLRAER